MASYFSLLAYRNQPVEAIFAATDVAEENRVRECDAATKIQSVARMRRARARYVHVRRCIVAMQRTYRGYGGRKRFLDLVFEAHQQRQRAIFDHFATTVQRLFRGYYSRKWRSDFYSQKHYLQTVEATSRRVREEAEERRAQQEAQVADDDDQEQRKQFRETARGLHHLLSTAVRSGVLRPAAATTGLQTVFGSNIEDDLRQVASEESAKPRKFRSDLIPRKSPSNVAPTGGSAIPAAGIGSTKYQRSLQSSAPYDAEREHKNLERAIDASMASQYHRTTFVTRRAVPAAAPPTLLSESEYVPAKLQSLKKR